MTTSKVWYSLVCDNSVRADKRIGDPISFEGYHSPEDVVGAFGDRFRRAGLNVVCDIYKVYSKEIGVHVQKYSLANDSWDEVEKYFIHRLTDAQVSELPEFYHCDSPTCRYEECAGADENPRKETFGIA